MKITKVVLHKIELYLESQITYECLLEMLEIEEGYYVWSDQVARMLPKKQIHKLDGLLYDWKENDISTTKLHDEVDDFIKTYDWGKPNEKDLEDEIRLNLLYFLNDEVDEYFIDSLIHYYDPERFKRTKESIQLEIIINHIKGIKRNDPDASEEYILDAVNYPNRPVVEIVEKFDDRNPDEIIHGYGVKK